MKFSNEKELQYFMVAVMLQKGISVEIEVRTHNGRRVDLLTKRYAIECKTTLTRDALLQAAAQMKLYSRSFPNHEYVLAGMSPRSRAGYKAAHSTAVDIKKEFGYTTWFIDRMSFFMEQPEEADPQTKPKTKPGHVYPTRPESTKTSPNTPWFSSERWGGLILLAGIVGASLMARFLSPSVQPQEVEEPIPTINFTPNEDSTDYASSDWKSGFYDGQDAGEEEAADNPECFFYDLPEEMQSSSDYASGYEAGYEDSCESIYKDIGDTEDNRADYDPLRGW